ncbi:hypothetical protein ACFL27_17255, partial [candidate division CSSED10-310 bacterium]
VAWATGNIVRLRKLTGKQESLLLPKRPTIVTGLCFVDKQLLAVMLSGSEPVLELWELPSTWL